MDLFTVWQDSVLMAWSDLSVRFLSFLPIFLGSILVFVLGIVVAGWLSKLVDKLLRTVGFTSLAKTAGIDAFLKKADIEHDTVGLISATVKWFVILVFFMATVNILGLTGISIVLDNLLGYLPRVIAAVLIVAAGMFLANIAEGLVRGALSSVDHMHARPLAKIARWLITIVAVMAAVNELHIAETLVTTFFQGLTWTVTLTVGLAVGLGSKDLVSSMLRDWYDKLKK